METAAQPSTAGVPVTAAPPLRHAAMQIRILVVDDEQDNCDYLKLLLAKEGYEVTCCTNPTQVLDLVKQTDYHLVVLDMMMPQMSGTEVLTLIRKHDSDLAVVVAT